MFRIKRSSADILFSFYIRYRDKWQCQRCLAQFAERDGRLQNSHFYGRGGKSTRWDEENCVALCAGCHQYFSCHPVEHSDFFRKRLGTKKFDALVVRAHTPTKVDEKLIAIALRAQLKKMGIHLGRGPALSGFEEAA